MRPYTAAEKKHLTIRKSSNQQSFHLFRQPFKPSPLSTLTTLPHQTHSLSALSKNPLSDLITRVYLISNSNVTNRSSSPRLSDALTLPAFPPPQNQHSSHPPSLHSIHPLPGRSPPPQSRFTLPSQYQKTPNIPFDTPSFSKTP